MENISFLRVARLSFIGGGEGITHVPTNCCCTRLIYYSSRAVLKKQTKTARKAVYAPSGARGGERLFWE